jgi:hypothetical protein
MSLIALSLLRHQIIIIVEGLRLPCLDFGAHIGLHEGPKALLICIERLQDELIKGSRLYLLTGKSMLLIVIIEFFGDVLLSLLGIRWRRRVIILLSSC